MECRTESMMRSRLYSWYILGVLTAANFLHYGNRNILTSMYEDLRAVFAFSNAELGLLQSAFTLPHALVTLFFGWAGDHFDRRRVIALAVAVWSVAGVASVASSSWTTLMLSRALIGIGTAACVPLANALLCQIFRSDEKAGILAIFNLGLFVGGAVGIAIGAAYGYPSGILLLAVPGLVLAILVYRLDLPPQSVADRDLSGRHFVAQVTELLRIPTLRWILAGSVIMSFAAGAYAAWLFDFLAVDKGMGNELAFNVLGIAFFGGLV
ncbi:MAG: MFS transporter, partial [Myxococcota bacterium]